MLRVVDHSKISESAWCAYVKEHPFGSIFHSNEIFQSYYETPELDPFGLFCVDDSGRIRGMALGYYQSVHKGFLAPFTKRIVLMNAPISDNKDSLCMLLKSLRKKTDFKAIYLEIRNHYNLENELVTYSENGYHYEQHLNILVDLTKNEEQLWKDVSSSRRREIKKALKEGFEFHDDSPKVRSALYPILQEIYTRAKLPLMSRKYFDAVISMGDDLCQVLGLTLHDAVVGALLVLKHKGTVFGLFGGSREAYFKQRPNDLLFWSAILWAKKMGFDTFDWMGAGHPDTPYGVRDWKKQFGGEFVNFGRLHYYPSKPLFFTAGKVFSLLRRQKSITDGRE